MDQFKKRTKQEWLDRVERDLKGAPLESLHFTTAGHAYSPFHHPADTETHYPAIDGMPSGHRLIGLEIAVDGDAVAANRIALDALNRGADLILFRVPLIEAIGKKTRKQLLSGILTGIVTVAFTERLYKAPGAPLLIQEGKTYHVDALTGNYADALYWAMESYVEDNDRQPTFHVRATPEYLTCIARQRALRLCWQHISEACGERTNCRILGHARPVDPDAVHQNKIAATTEAMSLLIGGADGLIVHPSDGDVTNGFSRRVALNLQHLLEYEAHLTGTPDPAAGSYYLERLTTDLAEDIYARFQQLTTDSSYQI